jgi:hypothetical protein
MDRSVVNLRNVGHGVNDIFLYILPSLLPVILDQFGMKYGSAEGGRNFPDVSSSWAPVKAI